jgi:nucleoid-associated protein YgaU
MRKINKFAFSFAAASLLAATFVIGAEAQRPALRKASTVKARPAAGQTVPSGTKFRARMESNLSSKVSQVGDQFTAKTLDPVYSSRGAVVIPQGSEIVGRVDRVQKAVKGGKVGEIDVSFRQIVLPNGTKRTINGSLTDLREDDAKSDNEGTAKGDKTKYRKVIFIGGGGVGGAVLGGAIGGGKGALIGGLIGAGAGLLGERFTKGEEAEVKSGSEFGVYLNQSITLPKYAETSSNDGPYDGPRDTPSGSQTYVVRSGDTLSKISSRFYGTTSRYMEIYEANRDQLSSPTSIKVGQTLVIP